MKEETWIKLCRLLIVVTTLFFLFYSIHTMKNESILDKSISLNKECISTLEQCKNSLINCIDNTERAINSWRKCLNETS